jgi:cruciform cutting endonuclease 1
MPHISFDIDTSAEATRQALLPRDKATRKKRSSKAANDTELTKGLPTTEIKKLDDITDCFLQAAAWVAWESNRLELQAMFDTTKSTGQPSMDEGRILKIIELLGDA